MSVVDPRLACIREWLDKEAAFEARDRQSLAHLRTIPGFAQAEPEQRCPGAILRRYALMKAGAADTQRRADEARGHRERLLSRTSGQAERSGTPTAKRGFAESWRDFVERERQAGRVPVSVESRLEALEQRLQRIEERLTSL